MTAAQWGGASAIFLASAVEWVEAFTIVLAVALTIGWRRAAGAAAAGLAVVALLIAVTGAGIEAAAADIALITGRDRHFPAALRLALVRESDPPLLRAHRFAR